MSAAATLEEQDGRVFVRGSITLQNVEGVLERARSLIGNRVLRVDFTGLREADSAAIALMLAWKREAAARGASIAFENCSGTLRTLIALYDVGELIACG
jgi:phospholipid transport system transporter-binding protein